MLTVDAYYASATDAASSADGRGALVAAAVGATVLERIDGPQQLPLLLCVGYGTDAAAAVPHGNGAGEPVAAQRMRHGRSQWRLVNGAGRHFACGPITVINAYYAAGDVEAVLAHRVHASDVRRELGFPPGRVLVKLSGTDLPDVVWCCDYPSVAARRRDARAIEATAAFQAVMAHMRSLTARFERGLWRVVR